MIFLLSVRRAHYEHGTDPATRKPPAEDARQARDGDAWRWPLPAPNVKIA